MSDLFDITVFDKELNRLMARAPDRMGYALEGTINDISALALRELATYPIQRTGTDYVRTMTLSRSWSRQTTGHGLEMRAIVGSNANMAPYNIYVQDEDRQAEIHRGYWPNTVQGVRDHYERPAQDMFRARVETELRLL